MLADDEVAEWRMASRGRRPSRAASEPASEPVELIL